MRCRSICALMGVFGMVVTLFAAGCGGGGGATTPATATTGAIAGVVRSSATQNPVANATVSAEGQSVATSADGSFRLDSLPTTTRIVITIEASGYIDAKVVAAVVENRITSVAPSLVSASPTFSVAADQNTTVAAPNSLAAVDLFANSLVVQSTGANVAGTVQARVTPIDPLVDPLGMPGDYSAVGGTRIESFGAIEVKLTDSSGSRLNLKPGSTATIRIPVATRSPDLPDTIPLYYFNESTGLWVQEGSATLKGLAPHQYYEGSVTHFSYWNADQPQETVHVDGCVRSEGNEPIVNAAVRSTGIDYSGSAKVWTDGLGSFRVPVKKSGLSEIRIELPNETSVLTIGPLSADSDIEECFRLSNQPVAPRAILGPFSQSVDDGERALFLVIAGGTDPLSYQWLRNGLPLDGETRQTLLLPTVSHASDNGAVFSVRISNAAGEATSSNATLSVNPPAPPQLESQPQSLTVQDGAIARFGVVVTGSRPFSFQWRRNGVDIDGAIESFLEFTASIRQSGDRISVHVSNRAGEVVSSSALLTVTEVPLQIEVQPQSTTAVVDSSIQFSVGAVGPQPISYQWRRDGVDIEGATSATYRTPNVSTLDSNSVYSVVVSSGDQSIISADAVLTVVDSFEQQTNFLALESRVLGSIEMAMQIPLAMINENNVFVDPSTICATGEGTFAFNGQPIAPNTRRGLVGTHSINLSACGLSRFGGLLVSSGSATATYVAQSFNPVDLSMTTTFSPLRLASEPSDVTVTGDLAYTLRQIRASNGSTTTQVYAPVAGAMVRNEVNGKTAIFRGGNQTVVQFFATDPGQQSTLTTEYKDLQIELGGVLYSLSGTIERRFGAGLPPVITGETVLKSGGVQVARLFYGASGFGEYEINGPIQPFD